MFSLQIDNGAEFQTGLDWHALDRGIHHVGIKLEAPRLNSQVEHSHRVEAEELYRMLDGLITDDTYLLWGKLRG